MFKLGLAAIAGFILGLLLIGITAALADDKIVVINHAPKASPISAYVKAYQEGVPNSVYYQAKNCEDANRKFEQSKNAIFVLDSDIIIPARTKGMNCEPKHLKAEHIVHTSFAYYRVCVNANYPSELHGKSNTSLFGRKVLGIFQGMLSPGLLADLNDIANFDVKGVPFKSSVQTTQALVSGMIDIGMIMEGTTRTPLESGKIVCPYSTNPNSPDIPWIGQDYPEMWSKDLATWMMIYTKHNDPILLQAAEQGAHAEGFAQFLKTKFWNNTRAGVDQHSEQDVTAMMQWLDTYTKAWQTRN